MTALLTALGAFALGALAVALPCFIGCMFCEMMAESGGQDARNRRAYARIRPMPNGPGQPYTDTIKTTYHR